VPAPDADELRLVAPAGGIHKAAGRAGLAGISGQGAILMWGLEKVRAEFSLTTPAYNLRRVLNIVGFTELMASLTA